MKRILFTAFLIGFVLVTFRLSAQNYTISPSNELNINISGSDYEAYIYVDNNTASELKLVWVVLEDNIGATGWEYNFCDIYNCYLVPLPDTTHCAVAASAQAFFKLAIVDTYGKYASGTMKIYIYEEGDATNGDTLTYNVSYTTGIEDNEQDLFSIYPNPVLDELVINSESTLSGTARIYDIEGRIINTFSLKQGQQQTRVDLSALATGSYVLEVENNLGRATRKVIQKR